MQSMTLSFRMMGLTVTDADGRESHSGIRFLLPAAPCFLSSHARRRTRLPTLNADEASA